MSNNNKQKELSSTDLAALSSSIFPGAVGGSAQDAIAMLLARRLQKEEDEETEKVAHAKRVRMAQLEAIRQTEEADENRKAQCPHMKPNFRPAIGGQKDHKGNHHFVCQYCGKEFGNDIPMHLRIASEMIGGPQ